jgi:electron transfer flavoprotein beta subunit
MSTAAAGAGAPPPDPSRTGGTPLRIGVALKWVDLRPEVDPLSGVVREDGHSMGCSPADRAALEGALVLADRWSAEVVVVCCGDAGAGALLRDALAVGATRAVRIDLGPGAPSEDVAAALATVFAGVDLVCCGDYSPDRGSGSVPAYLAAHLDAAQALGLVQITPTDERGALTAIRRLDGGRREVLAVHAPAVVSVEGSSAELRRAGLAAVLAAQHAIITVVPAPGSGSDPVRARVRLARRSPYRPRARALPPPSFDLDVRGRILALTGALVERTPPRTVHADASEAADLVLEQLRAWGEIE